MREAYRWAILVLAFVAAVILAPTSVAWLGAILLRAAILLLTPHARAAAALRSGGRRPKVVR